MKELFREPDFVKVAYFRSVLEEQGIRTYIRNEHGWGSKAIQPIADHFPALCVMENDDYSQAMAIVKDHVADTGGSTEPDVECAKCSEQNPGNFDSCWSCGATLGAA